MKILFIIPAKTDSKRLSKKNLLPINGKSLIEISVDFAKSSKYEKQIIVSSESEIVEKIAKSLNVRFHNREKSLCGDAEVVDVYINIINSLNEYFDYVVCLQPDHPDREYNVDYYIDYMINNNYDDLITIEENFKRSGSVRIFKYQHLKNNFVSKRIGCLKDDATDIHFIDDFKRAENRMK